MLRAVGLCSGLLAGPRPLGPCRGTHSAPRWQLRAVAEYEGEEGSELLAPIKPQPRRSKMSKLPEGAKRSYHRSHYQEGKGGSGGAEGEGEEPRSRGPRRERSPEARQGKAPARAGGDGEEGEGRGRGRERGREGSRGWRKGGGWEGEREDAGEKEGSGRGRKARVGGGGGGDDEEGDGERGRRWAGRRGGGRVGGAGGASRGRHGGGVGGQSSANGAPTPAESQNEGKIDVRKRRDARAERKMARKERAEANAQEKEEILGVGPSGMSVNDLASRLAVSPGEVIRALFVKGVMAQMNQQLDRDAVRVVAEQFGVMVVDEEGGGGTDAAKKDVDFAIMEEADVERLVPRQPVVTVMGHVDHGKTSLLDYVRKSRVAAGEAGGITQSIGAYNVAVEGGEGTRGICFLDTPGHEAFSAMRARGAKVTDVAVVIVAADDGVQPQTREAVAHAQAAGVPIVVAINKVDKADANPERIKQQLAAECSLVPEEWGGDVPMIPLSAKTGEGVSDLLDMVLLVAETLELVANPQALAQGTVIESELDRRRGAAATVLVQRGTLRTGDVIAAGPHFGRVRSMIDDLGHPMPEAGPSVAVQVFGLGGVPAAGTVFKVYADEGEARKEASLAQERERDERLASQVGQSTVSLSSLATFDDDADAPQRINLVLKADASGTVEAIRAALGQLPQERVGLRYLLASPGDLTESDIDLAFTSGALVLGFNIAPSEAVLAKAKACGVEVWTHKVIYGLIDDVRARMEGKLRAVQEKRPMGQAKVKAVFGGGSSGRVAGVEVTEGAVAKGAQADVRRGKEVVATGVTVNSIRRFKDLVEQVEAGTECGLGVDGFKDWREGDVVEVYEVVTKRLSLEEASAAEQARITERREALGVEA